MKDSKLKIILPIVLIPIILLICIIGYAYSFKKAYDTSFKDSISEEDITKYLNDKYSGEFKNIKLIDSYKTSEKGGGGCPTTNAPYNDRYYYYYKVYSVQDDTEFVVTTKKQIFSITLLGCTMPEEQITDNLEKAKNNKRYLEIIDEQFSKYNYSLNKKYTRFLYESDLDIEIKIDDDFNKMYYNELLELKTKLNEEHKNLLDKDKNVSIDSIYIIFNDKTFRYSLWTINMVNDEEQIIVEIEDEEFLDYIGE